MDDVDVGNEEVVIDAVLVRVDTEE